MGVPRKLLEFVRERGAYAFRHGVPSSMNPYSSRKMTHLLYRTSYMNAWKEGWRNEREKWLSEQERGTRSPAV